ncbi:MAG TPA: SusC/RagA family TonB-linked outer membrane protein, partial [Chitinophagaceae bacterium]|nr:SusC/RagA family TonB-linked outer membrane protein [Chitinophagaceae bacterium]
MKNQCVQRKKLLTALTASFLPLVFAITARSQTVSGSVRSAVDNRPLAGVTIHINGQNQGTVTDTKGHYQLSGIASSDTLLFSYIGYENVAEPVRGRKQIDVTLEATASSLNQVVVIGYGTAKKKDLTGAITRVDMKDKRNDANVNLIESLAGAAAGLNVQQGGGASGDPSFSIRGQTSLSGSTQPLIVLDGAIFYGNIGDINPDDVASVDILKGASAAAVYGRRSANGVLIINTKKGRAGKSVFSLIMYTGFQGMTNNPVRVMDGDAFALRLLDWTWGRDVYNWYATHPKNDDGRPPRPDASNRETVASFLRTPEEKKNYLAGKQTNWVDDVLRQAPMQNYNLSLSGGSQNGINYYLSGSFSNIKGIQKNDQFKRTTVHSSISDKVTDWLEIGLDATYSYRDNSGIPASLSAARVASPLQLNNPLGTPGYQIYLGGELYQVYPLVYTYADNSDIRTNLFSIGTINIKVPWIKGLKYTLRYSRAHETENNNTFYSNKTINGVNNNGEAEKNPSESNNWILDNIINYSNSFGDHMVNATFLFSRENGIGNSSTLSATDFGIATLGYNDMGLGQFPTVASTAYEENSLSYMARINYSYRSKYLLTATIRRDGYSGFSPNHKWAMFPSVAAGWVITEEPFLKDKGFYLKLRLSYGVNGNQGIGRYASFSQMSTYDYVYGSQTAIGIYPTTLGNKDLTWEKTTSTDVGFDFSFLKSRIAGSLDLYTGKTTDVLVKRQIPRASGYASVWSNLGKIGNKGIDFEVSSINIRGDFSWRSKFTFSLNRNKILKLYGNGGDKDIGNSWFVGDPIKSIYDYRISGVWQEKDLFNGDIYDGWYPGQFKYADLNHDGKIEPVNDREIIGYASPSYRFSIGNMLSYKNFTLSVFINSIQGGRKHYLANNFSMINPAYDFSFRMNTPAINPYWRPD